MREKYHDYKDLQPTGGDIEGPFYKAGAPIRLDNTLCGYPNLFITGTVLGTDGVPVEEAVLDWWQADVNGNYDNDGYNLRGKITTGIDGRYCLGTIRPGCYDIGHGEHRCPHLHVKISAVGCVPLMTQLYFVDGEYNAEDEWFDQKRVIKILRTLPVEGEFNFVLVRGTAFVIPSSPVQP